MRVRAGEGEGDFNYNEIEMNNFFIHQQSDVELKSIRRKKFEKPGC